MTMMHDDDGMIMHDSDEGHHVKCTRTMMDDAFRFLSVYFFSGFTYTSDSAPLHSAVAPTRSSNPRPASS